MPEILPGEFLLTGTIFELVGTTSGGDPTEVLSALTGMELRLTSNIPSSRPIRREDGVFFVAPRTVTVLDDGQISEDGENPGIALLGDDPGLGFNGTLQWTITPGKATIGGKSVKPISWTFYAPEPGSEYTLGEVAPVLSLSATQLGFAPTIDNVALNGDNELQFYVGATEVGDPVSLSALFEADGVEVVSRKGQANGYVPLNGSGLIDSTYLPSYVDDVLEYANSGSFPGSGATGKVYVAIDTGDAYRWSGSAYVRISDRVTASGITDSTSTGRSLITATDAAAAKTTLSLTKSDVGLSNVDNTSDAAKNAASAALTNKDLSSGTNTFPTFNQSTTGSAATLTTSRTFRTNLASTSTASFNGSADATPGVTGTLPVGNGGTGVATLTGIAKGNGTSAFTAATAGTDYLAPGGALGTPSSGTLTNCTGLPNAGLTNSAVTIAGTSVSLGSSISLDTITGLSTTGVLKRSAANTLAVATAGTDYVVPGGALGTPASGTLTNCTFPTLNQNTTGSAATLTTARAFQTNLASTSSANFDGSAANTHGVTGTLPVGNGGSGATSLTGLLVGNGTSAFTAVTAPSGTVVGTTDSQTLTNKTLTAPLVNIIKDVNGNNSIGINATASAVNYLNVVNASTGNSVSFRATGSDTDIASYFFSKGTGLAGFRSDNGFIFVGSAVASAVNYFQASATATGNSPTLAAVGSDTNVDFLLTSKGSGAVKANGIEIATISGAQALTNKTLTTPTVDSFKDSNGNTVFGFSATGSAVNYLRAVNRNTGLAPYLEAVGSDTNVGMRFVVKGTGNISFKSNAGADPLLDITPVANAVNSLQFTSGATGTAPAIYSVGSDTNVDLILYPQGTGVVKIGGTVAANTVVTRDSTLTLANKTLSSPKITNYICDSNGNVSVECYASSTAVNYLRVVNSAAGNSIDFAAMGADSNIPMRFVSRGTGAITLATGGGNVSQFLNVASAVNYTLFRGAATGSAPSIQAGGSDTNIDLNLLGTGTGVVKAGGVEVVTLSGSQTLTNKTLTNPVISNIKTSGGSTLLALSPAGTPGDYIQIWADTGGPTVGASGSSTNIHMYLQPKGNGSVKLYVPTGQTPTLNGTGPDTNHDLNLTTKGSGVVKANGVEVATLSGSQALTNKTLTAPTITDYTESVVAIGNTSTAKTISLTSGTAQTATLTGNCTFTMPTATAGKSFTLLLSTGAGGFTATFTGVKWGTAGAPTVTAAASKMDILTFIADGTNWYGFCTQGFTP